MIHLLWCTIRPSVFKQMHEHWMLRAKNPNNIKTHVAVNTVEHFGILSDYLRNHNYRMITTNTDRIGVCYPSYKLSSTTEGKKGDIVVFASDDFFPPKEWDVYLEETLKDKEGLLFVRDGYQLPDSSNMARPAITIPIMTWGCFEKLNKIIYHPSYTHMWSDVELYLNAKDLGLLIDNRLTDETIFEHLHYAAGKRNPDQLDQMYSARWKEDEITWNIRKDLKVEDRLKVRI